MKQVLFWIGFQLSSSQQALIEHTFGSFNDVKILTEKDMRTIASNLSSHNQYNGRMSFGNRRIKYKRAFNHWVQDFYCTSGLPPIFGLSEVTFKPQLYRASTRADMRKSMENQTRSLAGVASSGPLESEKQWKHWEEHFVNYTRSHIGVKSVPLSYVICQTEEPDINGEHLDFINKKVACAPLEGKYDAADRMSIFDMFVSLTTSQPSGDWIKTTMKHSDGWRLMKDLRINFSGEGNVTHNLAESERLNESLHYKSKGAMYFKIFLTQCQKMFNIY